MKRVLVFGMTENPGGVESVIMNYFRHLDRSKVQFDFLCNSEKIAYEKEIIELGGTVFKVTPRKKNFYKFRQELKSFMRSEANKYDVIWVNVCSLVNIDYLVYAKKYGIPKRIIHCHNADNDGGKLKKVVHNYNKKQIRKYATHFWSCSDDAAEWFFNKEIIGGNCYRFIPNAIEVNRFKKNINIRKKIREEYGLEGKVVVGHVGRFHFQKNHRFLIEIFAELVRRNNDFKLLLVGQGILEQEIKKMVQEKELSGNVIFCGVKNKVEDLYQAMDCFVLPSLSEGLGIVAVEAQANALPCVLSDAVPKEVKVNKNVCFYSLEKSPSQWADKIEQMIQMQINETDNRMLNSRYNIATQIDEFERTLLEK